MTGFLTRPELQGNFGMVASTHWLASAAGMGVLERGGNAFDAAVTAGFVLQVVEPHLNGPGGDMPLIGWDGAPFVICGQGVTPAAASVARLRELGLDAVPGTGFLAACVPGAFGAWLHLLRSRGTLSLGDALAPAIAQAGAGFPVLPAIARTIGAVAEMFVSAWPSSAELWLDGGRAPAAGTWWRNPVLAAAYERIVAEAEAATRDRDDQIEHARTQFYAGWVAEAIVEFQASFAAPDTSGRRHHGLLVEADLGAWRATEEAPVTYDYRGVTVCKTGAWGQGPVQLQQLALLAGADVDAPGSADRIHRVIEGAKLCFADREAYYGDSADPAPLDALLSDAYAAGRRALIADRASLELRPGSPDGRIPRLPATPSAEIAGAGLVGEPTRGDTCHLDVADRWGNLVSATPSGGWLQSSPAIPGLGFCLGTRAQMCRIEDGLPASLVGGVRPRTTLSPSLALRDGEGWLAYGTPGGDQQDQWSLLLLLNVVDHGMNLQEAIDFPAYHSNHAPSSFFPRASAPGVMELEVRGREDLLEALSAQGHTVLDAGPWALGRLSAVAREPDGRLRAGANARGMQGYAAGR
ncbi:MAG: gamma-glutamyltranspeptidase / glutathione hydrolase [Solirubrobacteraceae bacterium]|jgi:gamma-glutamyltranspeptidase/glutathione hydrolase|nr:gamma-glutamyltranspeptidase / glutathione hydrolase [Solirubrobacteraceae bacterium]